MAAIQPHYLTLGQLLGNRLFEIPNYQRAYSWETKQRADLFSDVEKTYGAAENHEHFMATVVGLRRSRILIGTDNHSVIEVVDGQQRLTTLILLLKAIEKVIYTSDSADANKRLSEEISSLLVKPDNSVLLLQTNHDTSHIFSNYLRTGEHPSVSAAETLADRHLLSAIRECEGFVKRWTATIGTAVELVASLKNRLAFIFHETEDERAVYTVFEVLNSRGLDVSWFDRLKSILMGAAFELEKSNNDRVIKELQNIWTDIYRCIGLRQGMSTEALRFAATLRLPYTPSRPLGEADSVSTFQGGATSGKAILDSAHWLLTVTQACDWVIDNKRLNAVTNIAHARLLAVAIRVSNDIPPEEKGQLLKLWENVTFRIFPLNDKDARTGVGDYVRLAWSVCNGKLSTAKIAVELKKIGEQYPIEEAAENLRGEDCYSTWQDSLRYFLFRREEFIARSQGLKFSNEQWERIWAASVSDSIEHVWPQSGAPATHVHRIGNLVLLPPRLNSELANRKAVDKREAYVKTGLLIAQEVAERLDTTWNRQAVEAREAELIEWAKTEWADNI